MWRGGVGAAYLLPALSLAGASLASPCFRFHTPSRPGELPQTPAASFKSSSSDGSYVLLPIGGGAYQVNGQTQVESTVSPEYTPNEQMAQAARGIASLVEAIRTARANKVIAQLRQRAAANAEGLKSLLAAGTASHLETTAPIAPSARRTGAVAFVQPATLNSAIVNAVVVVSDSAAKHDYFVTLQFHL
jgi:hypothetical protein